MRGNSLSRRMCEFSSRSERQEQQQGQELAEDGLLVPTFAKGRRMWATRGLRRGGWRGSEFVRGDDDDVDATVETAAVFAGSFGDGVVLGIACGGEALGPDAFAREKQADDFGGAGGREFPVGIELKRMDGDVVGVAFNAEIAADRDEDRADTIEGFQGAGAQGGRAAVEKSNLTQAEHKAFGRFAQRDRVPLELFGEIGLKLAADGFGGVLGAGRMCGWNGRGAGNDQDRDARA